MTARYPPHVEAGIARGHRLECWTIAWIATVVPLMAVVMGSSQAMKTVWIEDMLGLIPPTVYLISTKLEKQAVTEKFPYGLARANTVAFVASAAALVVTGAFLLIEALMTLAMREHPSVGTVRAFGRDIWLGWAMILVLLWSTVPSMILGRMKLPIAKTIADQVLHTDAEMQKADWMTGIAAMGGVIGIGYGLWWADAAAGGLISLSILKDGVTALRASAAELVDGAPRELENDNVAAEAQQLKAVLGEMFPGAAVRLRETGRVIRAQVAAQPPAELLDLAAIWPGEPDRAWRFAQLSFVPPAGEQTTLPAV